MDTKQAKNANTQLNQVYDPKTDTWSTGASMPTSRFGLGVAVVNDVLYAIGGVLGWWEPMTAVNEQYTPFGFETVPPPDTTPPPQPSEPFPTTWVAAAAAAIAIGSASLAIYYTKRKRANQKTQK